PLIAVPDVEGLDEQEALAILRSVGLTPSRRVERRSSSVTVGHVVRTRPRAGGQVPVGTRIAFVVAVAPRPKRAQARREARRSRGRLTDDAFLSMPSAE
ncbi:MAG: PASTA domain-containing protein, partial [Candidatus Limnocylindrales bacterium]